MMSLNMMQPDRLQMAIWRVCMECWITKASDTHSEYEILLLFHCNKGCTYSS